MGQSCFDVRGETVYYCKFKQVVLMLWLIAVSQVWFFFKRLFAGASRTHYCPLTVHSLPPEMFNQCKSHESEGWDLEQACVHFQSSLGFDIIPPPLPQLILRSVICMHVLLVVVQKTTEVSEWRENHFLRLIIVHPQAGFHSLSTLNPMYVCLKEIYCTSLEQMHCFNIFLHNVDLL